MFCKKCGENISDCSNAKCPFCGERIVPPTEKAMYGGIVGAVRSSAEPSVNQDGKLSDMMKKMNLLNFQIKIFGLINFVACLIIVILLLILFFKSGPSGKTNNKNGDIADTKVTQTTQQQEINISNSTHKYERF